MNDIAGTVGNDVDGVLVQLEARVEVVVGIAAYAVFDVNVVVGVSAAEVVAGISFFALGSIH